MLKIWIEANVESFECQKSLGFKQLSTGKPLNVFEWSSDLKTVDRRTSGR